MSDIVENLRLASYALPSRGAWIERCGDTLPNNACTEAADEIERLRKQVDQYRGLCRHAQIMLIDAGNENAADNIEAQVHRIDAGEQ